MDNETQKIEDSTSSKRDKYLKSINLLIIVATALVGLLFIIGDKVYNSGKERGKVQYDKEKIALEYNITKLEDSITDILESHSRTLIDKDISDAYFHHSLEKVYVDLYFKPRLTDSLTLKGYLTLNDKVIKRGAPTVLDIGTDHKVYVIDLPKGIQKKNLYVVLRLPGEKEKLKIKDK